MTKQFIGVSAHRYKSNPLEEAFAGKWEEENSGPGRSRTTLDYLMDPNNRGEPSPCISERDWLVASTLIQWLGSPVGSNFLINVLSGPDGAYFRQNLAYEAERKAKIGKK